MKARYVWGALAVAGLVTWPGDRRAVRERGRQPILRQLRVMSREHRPGPPGAAHGRPQADDA